MEVECDQSGACPNYALALLRSRFGRKNRHFGGQQHNQARGTERPSGPPNSNPRVAQGGRVKVEMSEIQVRIPQIRVQVPEILIPEIRLQIPVNVQIPEIQLPEIHVLIPQIDVQVPKSPE